MSRRHSYDRNWALCCKSLEQKGPFVLSVDPYFKVDGSGTKRSLIFYNSSAPWKTSCPNLAR